MCTLASFPDDNLLGTGIGLPKFNPAMAIVYSRSGSPGLASCIHIWAHKITCKTFLDTSTKCGHISPWKTEQGLVLHVQPVMVMIANFLSDNNYIQPDLWNWSHVQTYYCIFHQAQKKIKLILVSLYVVDHYFKITQTIYKNWVNVRWQIYKHTSNMVSYRGAKEGFHSKFSLEC